MNGNPSWATSNAIYKKLKVELLENMLDLVLFLHKDPKKTRHYLEKYTRMEDFGLDDKKFEILVNDAINYNYHDNWWNIIFIFYYIEYFYMSILKKFLIIKI